MQNIVRSLVAAFLLQVAFAVTAHAAADPAVDAAFKKLMTATIADDYDGFVADCEAAMKKAMTKAQLDSVSKQIAPRVKAGYDTEYLGELKQHGYVVYLWKVTFKEGDDILASMSLKDGKVGGFYLR